MKNFRAGLFALLGTLLVSTLFVLMSAAYGMTGPHYHGSIHNSSTCHGNRCKPTKTPKPTLTTAPTTAPTTVPTTTPTSTAPTTTAPTNTPPTTTATANPLNPLPAQPAGVFYGDPGAWNSTISQYAHPGAMVIAGRDNYNDSGFLGVESAGGTVLIYLDTVVWNNYGTYHHLLFDNSACGPAVPKWPGPVAVNSTSDLADFRVGGVLQGKLNCVLEKIVADNPNIGGFFMDDLGSRSWFPNLNWSNWGSANQQAYRNGAIAITQTTRNVADEHGMIFLVNGTFEKGTLATAGGGYPDMNVDGSSLADGGTVEHHDGQSAFFAPYGCGAQWATDSQTTHGQQFMFDISSSSSGVTEYTNTNCFAWIANQSSGQYDGVAPYSQNLWHSNGL